MILAMILDIYNQCIQLFLRMTIHRYHSIDIVMVMPNSLGK